MEMKVTQIQITPAIARRVLEVVDAGLTHGKGNPVPGQMCVEAAVCFALGLPHSDDPKCVSPALRSLKIHLNDSRWSSNDARAKGLRRLAVAQLGSAGVLDEREFLRRVVRLAIQSCVPSALRAAASICKNEEKKDALIKAALACEREPTRENAVQAQSAAYAAYAAAAATTAAAYAAAYAAAAATAAATAYAAAATAAATAADAAARDKSLAKFAEDVVQILIDMKAPGCQWLDLTEAA